MSPWLATLTLFLVFGHAARRPPPPAIVTCEWRSSKEATHVYIFLDAIQEDTPLHATAAVCSSTTLLPQDMQANDHKSAECAALKSVQRVFHVTSFLLNSSHAIHASKSLQVHRVSHPDAQSAVICITMVPHLCEPIHVLLEHGAMLRITNGRLFWSWTGRDSSHLMAAPKVAKSESTLGDFEMRLPALCSYVRSRQTYMKGQPGMHKFTYKSEVAPGAEYFVGGEGAHKMKVWISHTTANVRYVFIYTWMNKALYYRTNPAWNLCDFRTFFASTGGAMVEIGNVPPTDPKYLRSDYRKDDKALARWTNDQLTVLAQQSGHPELAHAPVIFWGWSRDGMQAASYAEAMPSRTLGAIRYMSAQHDSERGFDFAGPLRRIPFLLTMADSDYMAGMDNVNFLRKGRAHGAPWVCAIMRHSTHGMNQDKFGLLFPWVISLLDQLPPNTAPYLSPPELRRPNTSDGWLGNLEKITATLSEKGAWKSSVNGNDFVVDSMDKFSHPQASASWFRTSGLASLWKEWNTVDSPTLQGIALLVLQWETKENSEVPAVVAVLRPPYPTSVTVQLKFRGTATEGVDYEAVDHTVTIPPEVSAVNILLWAIRDHEPEETETVEVHLTVPSGYVLLSASSVKVMIYDESSLHEAPKPIPVQALQELQGLHRTAPLGLTSAPSVPPTDTCIPSCGTHGKCNGKTCECDAGWSGAQCETCVDAPDCEVNTAPTKPLVLQHAASPTIHPSIEHNTTVETANRLLSPDDDHAKTRDHHDDGNGVSFSQPVGKSGQRSTRQQVAPKHRIPVDVVGKEERGPSVSYHGNGMGIDEEMGQCDFKGGVVRSTARGMSLEDCRKALLTAHASDSTVNGAEVSLDGRQLCWQISGVKGIKHPTAPNPKFRCLLISSGSNVPIVKTHMASDDEKKIDAHKELTNLMTSPEAMLPVLATGQGETPSSLSSISMGHTDTSTLQADSKAANPPTADLTISVDYFNTSVAQFLADDHPFSNPLLTVVGYTTGGLLLLLMFRGCRQARRFFRK